MSPSPPRLRPFLSRLARELHIDSTVILIVLFVALATGAGGMLVSANNAPPSPTPSSDLTAVGPHPTLDGDQLGQPTTTPAGPDESAPPETLAPTPSPTQVPTATPEPEPTSQPPAALTGYVWPIVTGRISSKFGPRDGGFVIQDGKAVHDGLDLATWCGDRIRAAHAGTVLYAGRKFDPFLGYSNPLPDGFYSHGNLNGFPIVIVIDDGNGYRSIYVHLSVAKVGAGDVVKAGQLIGFEGATGHATGCHLHFELIRMDGEWDAVNPDFVGLYPAFARERVDPLLVLPILDPDAPPKLRENRGGSDQSGLPFDPPPAGSPGT